MATVVDLYQAYNTVTDWSALSRSVSAAYIKFTNGATAAPTPPDVYVRQCRAFGIRYGGYAFALPGDPVAQADTLIATCRRLGCQLAPALDLESGEIPVGQRAAFARAFLERLHTAFPKVVLYASASWLASLNPDSWPYQWDLTWAAAYGPNDGARHALTSYGGRVDMHQYTSVGRIAGVTGSVDLDWTDDLSAFLLSTEEDELQADEREALFRLYEQVCGQGAVPQDPDLRYPGWDNATGHKLTLTDMVRDLVTALRGFQASRIAGDTNQTTVVDLAFDAAKWEFEDKGTLNQLVAKLDDVIARLERLEPAG